MRSRYLSVSALMVIVLGTACSKRDKDAGGALPQKGPAPTVGQQALSPSIKSPAQPPGAAHAPGTAPIMSPAVAWAERMAKRLEGRRFATVDLGKRTSAKKPDDVVKVWGDALDQVTGQKVDAQTLYFKDILRFPQIWKGQEFLAAESQRYVGRIRQLPKDTVVRWRDGVKAAIGDQMEAGDVALALIQTDYLFEAEHFRSARSEQLLQRLQSLNPETVRPWVETLGYNNNRPPASTSVIGLGTMAECSEVFEYNKPAVVLELLDQDWLFDGHRVKTSSVEEALRALRSRTK